MSHDEAKDQATAVAKELAAKNPKMAEQVFLSAIVSAAVSSMMSAFTKLLTMGEIMVQPEEMPDGRVITARDFTAAHAAETVLNELREAVGEDVFGAALTKVLVKKPLDTMNVKTVAVEADEAAPGTRH